MDKSTQALRVHLLGDFRLVYGDEPVTSIKSARMQSLLAYLVLHRDAPQSRHYLAFLFWPDSTESQALTNLRNLLHHLRQGLPDADRFLQVDTQTVQWRPDGPFTLDVAGFESVLTQAGQAEQARDQAAAREALEEAVALYQGDLLPSCYDDWIRPERERLGQAFVGALEQLILLLEGQRDYRAAIGHARRLLRRNPLHEGTCRRLMRLHALTGDRAAALRVYHACATALERELGMEPSPATREAYQRLLQTEAVDVSPPAPGAELAAASPLVGRHREWARLREAWRAARAGQPHFVLLTGESGIGKTRLAEELIQWAERQGIAAASARCYAAAGELAYGPVAAWLRARPLPPLEPVWRSEIARLLPELLAEQPDLPPPGPLAEAWQRQRFFAALSRAVLGGSQPLLLLIDALQWCDGGTLEWLHYLLRADDAQPSDPPSQLLIVGTCRPAEVGHDHPLTSLLQALHHDRQLTEIALAPLDEAGTAELAANVAGREPDPDLAACLYRETEGNPLFVVETVRMGLLATEQERGGWEGEWRTVCLPRPLPSQMQAAIEARLAQLSPPARELAEVAATIGREFTFAVLSRASHVDEDVLVQAVDELWRRRIVREQGTDAYDFSHDKLREVAYASLSAARKRWLHRRVAQALEEVHASDLDAVSGQVAAHYEDADELQQAIPYYRRAALVAQRIHADDEATRYSRRGLTLLEAVPPGETAPEWRQEMETKLSEGLGSVTHET